MKVCREGFLEEEVLEQKSEQGLSIFWGKTRMKGAQENILSQTDGIM